MPSTFQMFELLCLVISNTINCEFSRFALEFTLTGTLIILPALLSRLKIVTSPIKIILSGLPFPFQFYPL